MALTINEVKEIQTLMAGRLKIDFPNFNMSFFRRRIKYLFDRMNLRRVDDLKRVLSSLVMDDEVTYFMSVPGTELFRDAPFWKNLYQSLSAAGDGVSIWLPCLSSYHDLFSLCILLDILGFKNCKIVVNVISDHVTRNITQRKISRKNFDIDKQNFDLLETGADFFSFFSDPAVDSEGPHFQLSLDDRNVVIRNGWFLNTDDELYDVVIMRNVLLSYNKPLHVKSVQKLVASLRGKGSLLCIGALERPLACEDVLEAKCEECGIYVKTC